MAAIDNVKHLIKYTGGSNDAARRNTLIADGPLKMDAGHFFAVVLQRPANAGAADLSYREVEFIMGEAFDVAAELIDEDLGWTLKVSARCSQLLADADAAGALDWDARYKSIKLLREAFVRRVRRDVPARLRSLALTDITSSDAADMPDDWWALMTGRALVRQDTTSAVLWQFRACFAYALCKRDRDDVMYAVILDMLGRGAVKDYDDCANGSVAAHVAALMRDTRFPTGLYVFFAAAEATSEIARRLANSMAARFAPLFDARWRGVYISLSEAFPTTCDDHEARDLISAMAAALNLGSKFTKVVADAAELAAKDALQSLDSQELRSASNQTRMQAIVRFNKQGANGIAPHATPGETKVATESQEQLSSLYGDINFKALVRQLEPNYGHHPTRHDRRGHGDGQGLQPGGPHLPQRQGHSI